MTTILDQPAKVDRDGERLYFYAPGEVCVDICSGNPEDRRRVMALLEHSQRMASLLLADIDPWADVGSDAKVPPEVEDKRKVLRDAGVRR